MTESKSAPSSTAPAPADGSGGSTPGSATGLDGTTTLGPSLQAALDRIEARLREMTKLDYGWLGANEESSPPTWGAVTLAMEALSGAVKLGSPPPRIYPTPEGGVQAEWTIGDWAVDVWFAPSGKVAKLGATNCVAHANNRLRMSADHAKCIHEALERLKESPMSESHIAVWQITVAGYGSFGFVGSEADAEAMRSHKSYWEGGIGRKERIGECDAKQMDRYCRKGPFNADRPESP